MSTLLHPDWCREVQRVAPPTQTSVQIEGKFRKNEQICSGFGRELRFHVHDPITHSKKMTQ